jgi:uncharacterized protein YegP (UPF0339 family)
VSYDDHRAEIYKSADGWRWRIKAANGEIIALGEAYQTKGNAVQGVQRVHPGIKVTKVDK